MSAGDVFTILLPGTWTFANESYPSDHSTYLWTDPTDPLSRIEVVVSGCVGCISNVKTGYNKIEPAEALPSGVTASTSISACKVAYVAKYSGDNTATSVPADSYPDNGLIVVIDNSGQPGGYFEVDLWLPSVQHALATSILNSFTLTNSSTC